jgi:hypothetical protein
MNLQWLNLAGLFFALAGAVVLASGLIISRKRALRVGIPRLAEDTDDSNVNLPHVRHIQRESRSALIGIILLVVGYLLQIVGNWPR